MKNITILVGPPGSGKTTYVNDNLKHYVHINQDLQNKSGHWKLFLNSLKDGEDIVIDRMGFSKEQRERYLEPARKAGYITRIVVFHVPSSTCLERCNARQGHPTVKTPEDASRVVDFFFRKYERVSDDEADVVERLGWDDEKISAVICDLDGTLCDISHRMHFLSGDTDSKKSQKKNWPAFFKGIPNDVPNKWCQQIIRKFENTHPIVYCSGRPDEHREATQKWLQHNNMVGELLMRRRNDFRRDDIVKEVILEFEIKTRFHILFWLDDRQQVVEKIRSHGVTVLQCCKGDY